MQFKDLQIGQVFNNIDKFTKCRWIRIPDQIDSSLPEDISIVANAVLLDTGLYPYHAKCETVIPTGLFYDNEEVQLCD